MKQKKYIKRFFIGLLALFFLLTTSVFILVTFYKKELADTLIKSLKDDYGLILNIEEINVSFFSNWPKVSVQLKNVYLASELSADKSKPVLNSGSISLSLDLLKLLKKEFIIESVVIKDAVINILKDENGNKNFELKSKGSAPKARAIKFEINKINVISTQFNFIDKERGQKIDLFFVEDLIKLKNEQDGIEGKFRGDVMAGGLLFKKEKGAFLKNKLVDCHIDFSLFTKSKTIFIHPPSFVNIDNHPFNLSSFIELNENKSLMLAIDSKNIDYEKGLSLLNTSLQNKLANFNVTRTIDAKITLITKLGVKQDPIILAYINGKNNSVIIGQSKVPYSDLFFKGSIISLDTSKQKGNTEQAKIIFKNIKGNIYGFPFTASVTVTNFDNPFINIGANLFINASKIDSKLGKEFILKGNCTARINYSGPTNKLNKQEFLEPPMKLKAALFFNNLSYQETGKSYVYTIDGSTNVYNKDMQFENLFLKTDGGNVILKGDVKNFTNYALGNSNGFKATLAATAESFNLNPYLIKSVNNNTNSTAKTVRSIKEEQPNFDFSVALSAKKLFIRNVKATNAGINLAYKNKVLDVRSVNMNACGGKLQAKGTVYDLTKINANVNIENMDVNRLFDEFENFGQNAIVSEQLRGNIFVNAKFKTELDSKMEVIGKTMDGEIKLRLQNGHLLNYQPLQNISDYIFRNRDFKDISFSEINETCKIKGFEMQISEMEIASNVLNLFVSGVYNFKENSNINILIPWSNLKKRGKNYIPKSSGQTSENSKGLKLNYSGPPKKLKLSLGHK